MYVDLSSSLSYNRRNEPKLVFNDTTKADTKTLPKVSQSTLTSIPKVQTQSPKPQAAKPSQQVLEDNYATKPVKKRKFRFRYMILLASILLVAASLIWILSRTPATIAIPDVAGQTVAEAKETLKKANFEIGEEKSETSEKVEEGRIIRTDPDAGTTRKEGSKINLVVSSGKQSFQLSNYIGRKSTDVIAELKQKKVPENLIKIEEEESSESEAGTVLRQSPAAGTTYDLSKASTITLTVAKKVTSVVMPSYTGSSLEFTKNNLVQIVGIKEANIEVVEVSTAPAGTAEGTVVEQSPKAGEKVDLTKTRVKISIYKPKTPPSTSSSAPAQRGNQGSTTTPSQGNQQGNQRGNAPATTQSSSEGNHENSRD